MNAAFDVPEPIVRCNDCHGEGILPGLIVCASCHGEGRRARELADTLPPSAVLKRCACGALYDLEGFARLKDVGLQDDGEGGFLRLRNCACGSTIAVPAVRIVARVS